MCSKKCAKPDFPGSISLRDPVRTGICTETMFGNPVGTTITFRPLGSVRSVAWNGRTLRAPPPPDDGAAVRDCAERDGGSESIGSRMAPSAGVTRMVLGGWGGGARAGAVRRGAVRRVDSCGAHVNAV